VAVEAILKAAMISIAYYWKLLIFTVYSLNFEKVAGFPVKILVIPKSILKIRHQIQTFKNSQS